MFTIEQSLELTLFLRHRAALFIHHRFAFSLTMVIEVDHRTIGYPVKLHDITLVHLKLHLQAFAWRKLYRCLTGLRIILVLTAVRMFLASIVSST